MAITKFQLDELSAKAPAPSPVAVPVGEPVSHVSSISVASVDTNNRSGVWTCTPGRWVRQVKQAEFCHFLSGSAIFHSDAEGPVSISAGDVLYFPANSTGTWEIIEECRKIFIVFDEAPSK